MRRAQAAKKVAVNRKIHNLKRRIQAVKKFRSNLKNHKLMIRAKAVKKIQNLKKESPKNKKTQRKKINLKLLMRRKRKNF